ncbi:GAF domain-containing protein [Arthrobacter sp. MDT2-2]
MRFYAGSPLRGPSGYIIGTLCVIDQEPRHFTQTDHRVLRSLATEPELELNNIDGLA